MESAISVELENKLGILTIRSRALPSRSFSVSHSLERASHIDCNSTAASTLIVADLHFKDLGSFIHWHPFTVQKYAAVYG